MFEILLLVPIDLLPSTLWSEKLPWLRVVVNAVTQNWSKC